MGLLGVAIGSGFQGRTEKTGVVDIAKVFSDSDLAQRQTAQLRAMGTAREDMLRFVGDNRVFTDAQAARFRELSVKETTTAAEKAELDKIKADVIAANKAFRDLNLKQNPTEADRNKLQEYNRLAQNMTDLSRRWAEEFSSELQTMQDRLRTDTLNRARAAVREVAQKQGFNLVFVQDVAPYGANDLTPDALKAMNAKR